MTEKLTFIDAQQSMDVAGSDHTGGHTPLSITITGPNAAHIQSYDINENELLALFNLLYRILKKDYSEKIEGLRQLIPHGDSTEDIR